MGLLSAEQVTVVVDPDRAVDLVEPIVEVAAVTTGTLLLCFAGHGVLSADGRLHLAVCSTDLDHPDSTAVAWTSVVRVLRTSPVRRCRLILDCSVPAPRPTHTLVGQPPLSGRPAAGAVRMSLLTVVTAIPTTDGDSPASGDVLHTDLVGELVDLIHCGIPGQSPWLTLADLHPTLRVRLLARDLPTPRYHGREGPDWPPLIANAALKARQRAVAVLTEATRLARLIDNPTHQLWALADVAAGWAPVDPEQAEHLLTTIGHDPWRSGNLARVAHGLATSAPQRAAHLLDEAHRLAATIQDDTDRQLALAHVVWGLARIDPDRAEHLATAITHQSWRAMAHLGIVRAVTATDLDRAQQLAYAITDYPYYQTAALLHVAQQRAEIDQDAADRIIDDAERLARELTPHGLRALSLAAIARILTTRTPDRADRILDDAVDLAQSAPDPGDRVLSLTNVVQALAGTHPHRAESILDDAEHLASSISDTYTKAQSLMYITRALAIIAPNRAEHLAHTITDTRQRATALVHIAEYWTQHR